MSEVFTMDGQRLVVEDPDDGLLTIQQEMLDTIERVDAYCKNRGKLGGLDWGMASFNKAFDGLQSGLIVVGGQPNVGRLNKN